MNKRVENWIKEKLLKLMLPELRLLARKEGERIQGQIAALQALDIGFRGCGKIIVAARVDKRDFVHILDIPQMSITQYKEVVERIKIDTGAVIGFLDSPYGSDHIKDFFL